jgi:hypothetical protein
MFFVYLQKDMHMTKEQEKEVRRFLEMKGISSDCIDGAVKSIRFHETTKALRDDKDVKRGRDIMEFKPNPGKATLTQVGETQTYLGGDDRGLPIYQEDVDMIKKALPLAKRLIELQKIKSQEPVEEKPLSEMTAQERIDNWFAKGEKEEQTLRTLRDTIDEVYEIDPEELNMGPDTTENIHEISEEERMNLEAGWYKLPDRVKEMMLRSQGIKKNESMTHDDKTVEKIRRAATGFTAERQTDFPGAKHGEEWLRKHEEDIRDSGDVMFGVDLETQGLQKEFNPRDIVLGPNPVITPGKDIDNEPYPTTEEMKKYLDEQCNKNVSQDEDKKDPGDYYRYGNILKRMDDTHTRKNNDYGDAAYQGYKKYGPAYFLVQLHNKLTRLESLTINKKTQMVKDESIDDTLLDMANYAVMYLESRHRND